MTPERWHQISRIFKSAISLDGEDREAYVKGQCGTDESLRDEVEKLIESHKQASADGFIAGKAAEVGAEFLVEDDEVEQHRSRLNKGQQLGSYVILDALGSGGMGEVYLAKDTRLDRTVALKVLSYDVSSDRRRMQRFNQEAKVASSLNQPNILTIFEFGEAEGQTFLATEFIDGDTLRNHIHGKRLELSEILDISIQVLAALDAAHEARIVHRDIKPENVMIRRRDRVVKVLDFGLAKVTEKRSTSAGQESDLEAATQFKTAPGRVMGTVNYMSPEQAQAHPVDERTDIWSTGVMIYEMVAGLMPFRGATTSHTIVQILEKDPVPLTNFTKRKASEELQRIVSKALAKSPEERYQTAKDMLIDLRTLKKKLDAEAEIDRTSSPDTPRVTVASVAEDRGPKKTRVLIFAVIAMAVFTAGFIGVSIWRASRARSVASVASTPTPPPALAERTLTYSITVQKFKYEKPFQDPWIVAGEINFEADYQIRLNVQSPQDGHLYIFNEGPTRQFGQPEFVVFSTSSSDSGSTFLRAGQQAQIPDKSWLKFDKEQGVEKLWLIFADYEIPEFQGLKKYANTRGMGLVTEDADNKAIQNFLSKHQAEKPASEKGENETTLKGQGKLLVYPIRLEHH